jgi:superfamily II DNA or RNA helicase
MGVMSGICILEIRDEVNVKFHELDPSTRRRCEAKLKYQLPYAYHVPAFRLGRWDGKVGFFSVAGATYVKLLDRVLPILDEEGWQVELVDKRPTYNFQFAEVTEDTFADRLWPKGHPNEGEPVKLRDYQVECINRFIANTQGVQEIATGAGKTLMTASMSKLCEPYGRTLVIVPNKDLVRQTHADYVNLGLDVGVFFGDEKDLGHTHTIATWQSINSLIKRHKEGKSDIGIEAISDDLICVIVDEVHMAKADVLRQLLCGPFAQVPIRWGLTGTVPKEEHEYISLIASLGEVLHRLPASELQDLGVLSECNVNILQYQDKVEYNTYQEELSYLTTNEQRIEKLAEMFKGIAKSGNTLILVDRVKAGKLLEEKIPDSVFVSGAMKSKDRKDEYDEVTVADNKVIIATYGVAAVGINIPRIFNLVLVEPGKSFVRVIQSIGRGIRKAQDKDFVQIWDVTSTAKFAKRHLTKRKKFYEEANYPYQLQKVE